MARQLWRRRLGEHVALRLGRSAAVGLVVFAGLAFGVKTCVATFLIACSNDETTLPSPDGLHIAHRLVRYCEGPMAFNVNIAQTIELKSTAGRPVAKVFESDEDSGSMRWGDDAHLVIAVDAISSITSSEHQADGVQIIYHVPKRMLAFKSEKDAERQTEMLHQTGRSTESDYETGKKVDRFLRQWHEAFNRWAIANAVIDDDSN